MSPADVIAKNTPLTKINSVNSAKTQTHTHTLTCILNCQWMRWMALHEMNFRWRRWKQKRIKTAFLSFLWIPMTIKARRCTFGWSETTSRVNRHNSIQLFWCLFSSAYFCLLSNCIVWLRLQCYSVDTRNSLHIPSAQSQSTEGTETEREKVCDKREFNLWFDLIHFSFCVYSSVNFGSLHFFPSRVRRFHFHFVFRFILISMPFMFRIDFSGCRRLTVSFSSFDA